MKYQVWVRGCDLYDFDAESEQDARQQARDFLGVDRLPKNTCVCAISNGYYQDIVRMNREAGFNASNL